MALVLLLLLLPHTMAVRLPRWSIIHILHVQLDLIFPPFLCPHPSRLATQGGTGGAGLGS